MALLSMDGCDGIDGAVPALIEDPLWLSAGHVLLTSGRYGGGAIRMNSQSSFASRYIPTMSGSVFRHRWAMWATTRNSSTDQFILLRNNSNVDQVCELKVNNAGALWLTDSADAVVSGSTTADNVIKLQKWQDVEMVVTVHGSTGACEVWVDGISVISVTNQDFSITDTDVTYAHYANVGAIGDPTYYDDFIWCDGSAGLGDAFIGDHRIMPLEADADGDQTAWTRNGEAGSDYENVNDPLSANHTGDTDFLSAKGGIDLAFTVNLESLPITPASVVAVRGVHVVRKGDGGAPAGAVKPRMRHSVSEIDGAAFVLSTSWQRLSHVSEDVPGGSGWTEGQVNALQLGLFYDVP